MGFHGASNDAWVLSPNSSSRNKTLQHPRASTDTISSFSPLSNALMFATPSPAAESRKSHASFWKAVKQYLTCYSPARSKPKSKQQSSKGDSVAASKTSSTHSVRASPDHAYSAMSAEERDENLKAVITYCNKSMESGRRNDAMLKDCNRIHCA
ncbi:uncharacterized protein LOC110411559 [Herrania umbratica]|uniref:Uncharacterized protein LOC110411559 n=1 Tax=Herrania umbratica TaxID=108875 RepID=A0A6J0ZRV9_9ROSI|nr:uncharacterized protein LOC110411559 [Herrania umbratica]